MIKNKKISIEGVKLQLARVVRSTDEIKRRGIFVLAAGTVLFVLSTVLLMAVVGCNHRTEWLLPWLTISTSVAHPGFAVRNFAPFLLGAHLAVCFGLAWLLGLLVPITRKEIGPNHTPDGIRQPAG